MRKEIIVSVLLVLILAACSSQSDQGTGSVVKLVRNDQVADPADSVTTETGKVVDITIEAFNFGFTQSPATISKGDKVRITFTSSSGTHGLAIPDFGVTLGPVSPGEQETVEFVADKAGSFAYFCNVPCGPGHKSMRGMLTVQ